MINIPNLMSLTRLGLTIPIAWLVAADTPVGNQVVLGLVFLAVLTDYLDGYLARKFDQVSDLGKLLDPLADKIIMGVVIAFLVYYRGFPLSVVVLLVYRDIMILGIGTFVMKKQRTAVQPNFWGKLNTMVVSAVVIAFLLGARGTVFQAAAVVANALILVSGFSYYMVADRILFENNRSRWIFRLAISALTVAVVAVAVKW